MLNFMQKNLEEKFSTPQSKQIDVNQISVEKFFGRNLTHNGEELNFQLRNDMDRIFTFTLNSTFTLCLSDKLPIIKVPASNKSGKVLYLQFFVKTLIILFENSPEDKYFLFSESLSKEFLKKDDPIKIINCLLKPRSHLFGSEYKPGDCRDDNVIVFKKRRSNIFCSFRLRWEKE